MAGLCVSDGIRGQSRAAAPWRLEETVGVVWASGQDAPCSCPWGGVLDTPIRKENLWLTKDTLERLYFSAGLGISRCIRMYKWVFGYKVLIGSVLYSY